MVSCNSLSSGWYSQLSATGQKVTSSLVWKYSTRCVFSFLWLWRVEEKKIKAKLNINSEKMWKITKCSSHLAKDTKQCKNTSKRKRQRKKQDVWMLGDWCKWEKFKDKNRYNRKLCTNGYKGKLKRSLLTIMLRRSQERQLNIFHNFQYFNFKNIKVTHNITASVTC